MVTYLYALEVQSLIESGQEALLGDVREAYDIPEQIASEIVELSCKRYISQLLNLALRAAKRYKEEEAVEWTRQIAKYAVFVDEADHGMLLSLFVCLSVYLLTINPLPHFIHSTFTHKLLLHSSLVFHYQPSSLPVLSTHTSQPHPRSPTCLQLMPMVLYSKKTIRNV